VTKADDRTELYRERIWSELRQVARPDSRFHWDFAHFIADFEGSDRCAERVLGLDALRGLGERRLFVTPDNCLEPLRAGLIRAGLPFVMTTYGIVRGFLELDPAAVPAGAERYAATLDGFDHFARPVPLAALSRGTPFGLLVTGGSAVSRNGVRFGKGHGYFDFEFAVLSELGLVGEAAVVVDVVHDCQYVDDDLEAEAHDVPVDLIVTPTRTLGVDGPPRSPGRVHWELLPGTEFDRLEIVAELRALVRPSTPTS
jgi:5-formyltetrahydrofolate cyclo-ligase